MSEAYTIQVREENTKLRIDWDNSKAPKDNFTCGCLMLFWIIWAPVTLVVTFSAIIELNETGGVFLTVWCIFGWLGTILIPWRLLGRYWSEWIEITPETFTHGHEGFRAPKPRSYPIGPGAELFLGRCDDESVVTLSIWVSCHGLKGGRAIFAYWLAPKIKEQVFQTIAAFVEAHKIPLAIKKDGAR